jgi:hypothetical protein
VGRPRKARQLTPGPTGPHRPTAATRNATGSSKKDVPPNLSAATSGTADVVAEQPWTLLLLPTKHLPIGADAAEEIRMSQPSVPLQRIAEACRRPPRLPASVARECAEQPRLTRVALVLTAKQECSPVSLALPLRTTDENQWAGTRFAQNLRLSRVMDKSWWVVGGP